ncbi:hypothetical protein [Paracoccus spongiarum]|uniref:Uncharacterized protein n=1 Tax=Paracoccus spongiarum TaxID=3064387 RepID=A0ABT9J870_9RHOB|nr:hypothetical protein [Paracoccus sp. 2205BS29-5]MDP5306018.1 hypothetical protein [Paracoccus sp. 2205BS29-5]
MRHFMTLALLGWLGLGAPAHAWELTKGPDHAATFTTDGDYLLSISCQRGRDHLEFGLNDRTLRGDGFEAVRAVMMWIKAPDGRTDKWSIEVSQEGPSLTGRIAFSARTLDFFGNAESLEVEDIFGRRTLLRSDMKGTGAARIAFRERCGI